MGNAVFPANRNFQLNCFALAEKSCTMRSPNIFTNVCVVYNKHAHTLKTHAGALSSRNESTLCCGSLVLLMHTTNSKAMTEVGRLLQMSSITTAFVFCLLHVLYGEFLNYSWYSSASKSLRTSPVYPTEKNKK